MRIGNIIVALLVALAPVATGANGGTVIGSVAADATAPDSVNGVYDLKTQFGASGSNQTMTCTATAGANVLTGCTGGDFKLGSTVFIPQAGVSPTISAPARVTATCTAAHGASCAGTTVYGYRIVAVQGAANGPMSAPSAVVTVTQAAQTKPALGYATWQWVYTVVSWSAVTNASNYLIYKSVNGGPYNFYTITSTNAVTVNDSGFMESTALTCEDIVVPCTVPAGGTRNDVYAKVTAVNGSSYTLGARTTVPQYRFANGLSGGYPSTPQISGTVTVQHDDTPAIWAAHDFLAANGNRGNLQLHIPSGTYNLHTASVAAGTGAVVFRVTGLNNVTISGDGSSTYIRHFNDRGSEQVNFLYGQGAQLSQNPAVNAAAGSALHDPVAAGVRTVTLQAPSQASSYPPGTYVYIFPDNVGHVYPWSFYAELNRVDKADATTGVLSLAYPTTKQYAKTMTPPYSNCASCQGSPYIMSMGGFQFQNLTVQNLRYRGASYFANLANFDGFTLRKTDILASIFFVGGYARHLLFEGNTIHEDSYANQGANGLLMGAGAMSDATATHNTYIASHYINTGEQTCTEGEANINLSNNTMMWIGIGQNQNGFSWASGAPIGASAPCTGLTIKGNRLIANNTNMVRLISNGGGQVLE